MPRKASSFWKPSEMYWAPVVVADGQAAGGVLRERPEVAAHALADRLESLEACCPRRGVDPDAFGRAMVDGDEHRGLPLAGPGRGQVGAPHLVHRSGIMVPSWLRGPRGAPTREGASRSCSRISRRTRRRRAHPGLRNRAQSLRWPSP